MNTENHFKLTYTNWTTVDDIITKLRLRQYYKTIYTTLDNDTNISYNKAISLWK